MAHNALFIILLFSPSPETCQGRKQEHISRKPEAGNLKRVDIHIGIRGRTRRCSRRSRGGGGSSGIRPKRPLYHNGAHQIGPRQHRIRPSGLPSK